MRTLLVINRATGEIEKIPESDPNFRYSVASAALCNDLDLLAALGILDRGQELVTDGFTRRLEKATA
jgi:hypothetical protein